MIPGPRTEYANEVHGDVPAKRTAQVNMVINGDLLLGAWHAEFALPAGCSCEALIEKLPGLETS